MKRYNLYILVLILMVGALSSCQLKDNDLSSLKVPSKLVLYCFPNNNDTTWINLSESTPVCPAQSNSVNIKRKKIIFCVNDNSIPVDYDSSKKQYYVVQKMKEDDRISVNVNVDGVEPIMANTSIPSEFPLVSLKMETKEVGNGQDYHYLLTMNDNPDTKDYYAVRIQNRIHYELCGIRNDYSEVKVENSIYDVYKKVKIDTQYEPVLYNITQFDDLFGYENEFYQDMYIFDDEKINGKEYTLHLVDNSSYIPKPKDEYYWFYDELNGWNGYDNIIGYVYHTRASYRTILYKLDKETYTFMKNFNDQRNNGMSSSGLSPIIPNYTNVINGIGILGGMNRMYTDWTEID